MNIAFGAHVHAIMRRTQNARPHDLSPTDVRNDAKPILWEKMVSETFI